VWQPGQTPREFAELVLKRGGDPFTAPLPSGQRSKTENAGYYGSIALRLVL